MIAGLRGVVEEVGADNLLVNVGGVIYRVFTSSATLLSATTPGSPINLHTHFQLREDVATLYGFSSRAELQMFQLLLTVGSVGPRSALALLSAMSVDELATAIASEDIARLSSVTGIGKRTAARIALELKGKVGQMEAGGGPMLGSGNSGQLVAALTALGYSNSEAASAVRSIPNLAALELEEALREALRALSSGR